jgi:hypothetical protein
MSKNRATSFIRMCALVRENIRGNFEDGVRKAGGQYEAWLAHDKHQVVLRLRPVRAIGRGCCLQEGRDGHGSEEAKSVRCFETTSVCRDGVIHEGYERGDRRSRVGTQRRKHPQRADGEVTLTCSKNQVCESGTSEPVRNVKNRLGKPFPPSGPFVGDPFNQKRQSVRVEGTEPGVDTCVLRSNVGDALHYKRAQRYAIVFRLAPCGVAKQECENESSSQKCCRDVNFPHGPHSHTHGG